MSSACRVQKSKFLDSHISNESLLYTELRHFESLKKFYYYTASQTVCVIHAKRGKKYLGF